MNFSEKYGYKKLKIEIQIDELNISTRNLLWNIYNEQIFLPNIISYPEIHKALYGKPQIELNDYIIKYFENLWKNFFKRPLDTCPFHDLDKLYALIRKVFMDFPWNEVYDLIEFTIKYINDKSFNDKINKILKDELSAYRIVNNQITSITNDVELKMLEETIKKSEEYKFEGATIHLKCALDKLSNRQNPDYRNSIKESISAVESLCKILTNDNKTTLGKAIKKLKLHPSIEEGFNKFYGYTSDSDGIRHSLLDKSDIDFEDAYFFLICCSAFINYLIQKKDIFNKQNL